MKKLLFVFLLLASCKQTTTLTAEQNTTPTLPVTFTGSRYMNSIIPPDTTRYISSCNVIVSEADTVFKAVIHDIKGNYDLALSGKSQSNDFLINVYGKSALPAPSKLTIDAGWHNLFFTWDGIVGMDTLIAHR